MAWDLTEFVAFINFLILRTFLLDAVEFHEWSRLFYSGWMAPDWSISAYPPQSGWKHALFCIVFCRFSDLSVKEIVLHLDRNLTTVQHCSDDTLMTAATFNVFLLFWDHLILLLTLLNISSCLLISDSRSSNFSVKFLFLLSGNIFVNKPTQGAEQAALYGDF